MTTDVIGTVSELWRFPVKSAAGERVDGAAVTAAGVDGDRRFAILDVEAGRIASAKHPRRWGRLLDLAATTDEGDGTVHLAFPDGGTFTVAEGDPALDDALSTFFDREVVVAATAPEGSVYEEVWDEGKDDSPRYGSPLDPEEGRDVVAIPPSMMAPKGTFFDFSAIHLVTTSALAALRAAHPGEGADIDVRRFRPNLVIEVPDADAGFVENGWVRRRLEVGEAGGLVLESIMPTMRCVMTTLAQPGLDKEGQVLRSINAANRITVAGMGDYACLGLYCRVRDEGAVRVGDEVRLAG